MSELSPTVARVDYELCERENSNLRRLLLWVAEQAPGIRAELAVRIKAGLDDGGVVEEGTEETRETTRKLLKSVGKLCDAIDSACEAQTDVRCLFLAGRAGCLTSGVRGLVTEFEEQLAPNFFDLRAEAP